MDQFCDCGDRLVTETEQADGLCWACSHGEREALTHEIAADWLSEADDAA